MGKVIFGVDLGGTTVKMGLFDPDGNVTEKWEIPTDKSDEGKKILPDIADAIKKKMAEKNVSKEDVIGVGIGVPGPVDGEGVIFKAPNLGWGTFSIKETLSGLLDGIKVEAGNDANVAALGEMWKGGGKGYSSLVVVTLGTGVGGGIIVDGKILTGSTGAGGEIGHIHIVDDEPDTCGCGNNGCLEQYASATGVVRLAKRRLAEDNEPSTLREGELSAKSVFDAVKAGDPLAVEIAEEFGRYLGKGLAIIAGVTNPEVFVIGGGVSKAGSILIDAIEKHYNDNILPALRGKVFRLAELGNDAGIFGAARMTLEDRWS